MIAGRTPKPEDIFHLAWRWRWLAITPAILGAFIAIGVVRFLPDRYRSETLILVVPQRVPEAYVKSTVTSRISDRLQSISQQILSRTRLETVVSDFNLYVDERKRLPLEDVIEKMRADIDVQIVKGDAFRIRYASSDRRCNGLRRARHEYKLRLRL